MMTFRRFLISLFTLLFFSLTALPGSYAQSDSAKKMMASGFAETHFDNLKSLNSNSDDATPFVSPDGSTIYFSSYRNNGKPALFRAKHSSGLEWGNAEVFLELPGKEGISAISIANDGKTAILQCCNRADALFRSCDIYSANIDNGALQNIAPLGKNINSEWWEGQPCISGDGQLLFFASDRKGGEGGSDIYMCSKSGSGEWGNPVNMKFNTSSDELSPMLGSDNQTLYFASNASGGQGGFDIYVTYRKGDNEWTQPKNLGTSVNTSSNEMFFFVPTSEDGVYVSSDRAGGQGGFDIYRIVPNPIKAKPKFIAFNGHVLDASTNLPVRTQPDLTLAVSANSDPLTNTGSTREYKTDAPIGKAIRVTAGADGYVSGNIEVQTPSEFDPNGFSQDIKLTPSKVRISGHTTSLFTNAKITAKVLLEEVDDNGNTLTTQSVESDQDGAYSFDAKPFTKYHISASAKDYQNFFAVLDIPLKREAVVSVVKEIRMTPSDIKPVMVKFDYDKADLLASELPQLVDFIKKVKGNPNVKLEVQGHTDDRGSEEYNKELSERRAKTIDEYLLAQGVPRDQLAIVVGFGKSAPLEQGISDEARAKNRRVEIRIVGK